MKTYIEGTLVRCSVIFTDSETDLVVDPDTVTFLFLDPAGTEISYEYGVDTALVKDAVGMYHSDVDLDASGMWWYRFESTGVGQAANEKAIEVKKSKF